jgi:hypothetical protein
MNGLIVIFITAATALAADVENKGGILKEQFQTMKENVASIGITFNQAGQNLDIEMDQAKVLASIPMLEQDKAIPEIDEADLKNAPLSVSIYAIGITFSVAILTGTFANDSSLNNLHVTMNVIPSDGTAKQSCFSFDYTRDLYMKLDMGITTNEFINKAPNFKFSEYCKNMMEKENKLISKG